MIVIYYKIGELIRICRKKAGITQEELADGLCTVRNLQKIESNQQRPLKSTFEAIMQKMGQPYDFYSYMADDEVVIYQKRNDIRTCIGKKEYEKAEILLKELERDKELNHLYYQFILYVKTILNEQKNFGNKEILEGYLEALGVTIKSFEINKITEYLLTEQEMSLIHCIAVCKAKAGEIEEAVEIIKRLIQFYKNRLVIIKYTAREYAMFHYHLCLWLHELKLYQESLNVCEEGIDICKKFRILKLPPLFIFQKGKNQHELDSDEKAEISVRTAYNMLLVIEDNTSCMMIKEYMNTKAIEVVL